MHLLWCLGHAPPRKILKIAIIKLNLKAILAKNVEKARQKPVYTFELVRKISTS